MAAAEPPAAGKVHIEIVDLRNDRGVVGLAVFRSSDGFPGSAQKAVVTRQLSIRDRRASIDLVMPPGELAVAVIHDENRNGELDTNWLGIPKEGYGASRDARRRFGAPRWKDARLPLADGETLSVRIRMGY